MATIPVSCFGKLPIEGDLIRQDATGGELDELYRWFQEGIRLGLEAYGIGWAEGFDAAPPVRFLFVPEQTEGFLLGVWISSWDEGGRRFPFAVFLTLEKALFGGDLSLLPAVFEEFLDAAHDLACADWARGGVAELADRVAELEPTVDLEGYRSRYDDFVRKERASVFWKGLFGSSDDAGKYMVIQKLDEQLKAMARPETTGAAEGLRCPLPVSLGREGSGFEVTYSMDLGLQVFGGRGLPGLTSWEMRGEGESSSLSMFFGKPSPHWMLPVIRPDHEAEDLLDLGSGDFGQTGLLREKYESTMGRSELTLAGLLLEVAVLRSS